MLKDLSHNLRDGSWWFYYLYVPPDIEGLMLKDPSHNRGDRSW